MFYFFESDVILFLEYKKISKQRTTADTTGKSGESM